MSVNEKMTAIADTIRAYTDGTEQLGLDEMAQQVQTVYLSGVYDAAYQSGYDDGYTQGEQAQYDALWDAIQQKGTRIHYSYAFAYSGWNDSIFDPKYPITPLNTTGINNMFTWNQQITDTKVPITVYGNGVSAFANTKIKRIPKLIFNGTTNVSNMFLNCADLEELNCEGELAISGLNLQYSTKLSKTSIVSVINTLSATTSGLSITLSATAVTNAFGSTTATEWTALIATRDNWTISLV